MERLTGVSCHPPSRASRNHTHSTFPKRWQELLWVERPGTIERKIFTVITKISCSRVSCWGENKALLYDLLPARASQGEKLHWCHCALLQQGAMRLKCLGLGGGLLALHSRYGFEDSSPCEGSFISFKISILSKADTLLLIRKISQNLMFCASVSDTWAH